jgi:hypothetical protein
MRFVERVQCFWSCCHPHSWNPVLGFITRGHLRPTPLDSCPPPTMAAWLLWLTKHSTLITSLVARIANTCQRASKLGKIQTRERKSGWISGRFDLVFYDTSPWREHIPNFALLFCMRKARVRLSARRPAVRKFLCRARKCLKLGHGRFLYHSPAHRLTTGTVM